MILSHIRHRCQPIFVLHRGLRRRDDDGDDSDDDFGKVLMMLVMVVMLMVVTQYLCFGVCVQYLNSKVETFAL